MVLGTFIGQLSFGARVLFIGDSQSLDGFAKGLYNTLTSEGHTVFAYSVCASGPVTWVRGYGGGCGHNEHWVKTNSGESMPDWTSNLRTLLASIQPTVLIVQTGDNIYADLGNFKSLGSQMVAAIQASTVKSCAWITPPFENAWTSKQEGMANIAEAMTSGVCEVYASYQDTQGRSGFGKEHFSESASSVWLSGALPTIRGAVSRAAK